MKKQVILVALAAMLGGCVTQESKPGRYYQLASINAPLKNSDTMFTDLKWQGDFGYGAVETPGDVMIALDGKFYQADKNGKVAPIDRFSPSPFAVLTFFKASQSADWNQPLSNEEVKQRLDALLGSKKVPCAIRIGGELNQSTGTIFGFWLPEYMTGLNATGYQLFYLSADRTQGGRIAEFTTKNVHVEIDPLSTIHVQLPKEK